MNFWGSFGCHVTLGELLGPSGCRRVCVRGDQVVMWLVWWLEELDLQFVLLCLRCMWELAGGVGVPSCGILAGGVGVPSCGAPELLVAVV